MQRLFEQFIPDHYDLTWDLTKAPTERKINGCVKITGKRNDDEKIKLHAKDIDIISIKINDTAIDDFKIVGDELEIYNSGAGKTQISIAFSLDITDAMHGIYPCYYKINSEQKELYATQFESHHAREAFPCIDEPEAKAAFDISLVTENTTVLSNMPIKSQESHGDFITTQFDTSPRMSTYLVAFVVGDLQRVTGKTKSGVEINVYSTKAHKLCSLDWALEHAKKTIDFFDEYFGVPYPLPKSDHVALPDFSSGAMENWGLITYREMALLADPDDTTISSKRYISEVIAHELSHQWFGNLVTMKWWNNLWLNESFATIMEYLPVDKFHPDWNVWLDFIFSEGSAAFHRDCIDGVQPVQVDVNHPDEISSLFDGAIVYAKGGRLIRMMQTWIGEDAFREGLKHYFTEHKYNNTTENDLWEALSKSSEKNVSDLMNAWITQSGFPVVSVCLKNDKLHLSQKQFFVGPHAESAKIWPIPIDSNIQGALDIMTESELEIPFDSKESVYLNVHGNGHFIAHYDDKLRKRIIQDINNDKLSPLERAKFLLEQSLLARGGVISSASLVELLNIMNKETDRNVWSIMLDIISDLKKFVQNDKSAENNLKKIVNKLAKPLYDRLGWDVSENDSEDDIELRTSIISCMLYSEDADVIKHAINTYDNTTIDNINPELRSHILATKIKFTDKPNDIVKKLLNIYRDTPSTELRADIAKAVCASRDTKVIDGLLSMLIHTKIVRSQDVISWYVYMLQNKFSREATWKWLRSHWDWIEEQFSGDKSHEYFPRYTARLLVDRTQLEEYKEFFLPMRNDQSLVRAIDMGISDLKGKIELIERDTPAVKKALCNL